VGFGWSTGMSGLDSAEACASGISDAGFGSSGGGGVGSGFGSSFLKNAASSANVLSAAFPDFFSAVRFGRGFGFAGGRGLGGAGVGVCAAAPAGD